MSEIPQQEWDLEDFRVDLPQTVKPYQSMKLKANQLVLDKGKIRGFEKKKCYVNRYKVVFDSWSANEKIYTPQGHRSDSFLDFWGSEVDKELSQSQFWKKSKVHQSFGPKIDKVFASNICWFLTGLERITEQEFRERFKSRFMNLS